MVAMSSRSGGGGAEEEGRWRRKTEGGMGGIKQVTWFNLRMIKSRAV